MGEREMASTTSGDAPVRPKRVVLKPLPPIPSVDANKPERASVDYSHYRSDLSRHRTDLSEHRTDLSEFRTDLSGERTAMSMRRTGLSFQRSRMSADRTLMSIIRTALSLIGFGFTIYQAFQKFQEAGVIRQDDAPRTFGAALIALGVLLLAGGIVNHGRYMLELRHLRGGMKAGGLIFGETRFPVSIILLTAVALLLIGLTAIANVAWDVAPFR